MSNKSRVVHRYTPRGFNSNIMSFITKCMALSVAVTIAIKLLSTYLRKDVPKNWKLVATVKSLYFYPLKSSKGYEMSIANCTLHGLQMAKDAAIQLSDR